MMRCMCLTGMPVTLTAWFGDRVGVMVVEAAIVPPMRNNCGGCDLKFVEAPDQRVLAPAGEGHEAERRFGGQSAKPAPLWGLLPGTAAAQTLTTNTIAPRPAPR